MKMPRWWPRIGILVLTLAVCACRGADDPSVFVQKTISWKKTPHGYEMGNGSIVLVDPAHHFLELTTQLYRDKGSALTIDLKSGYLVRVGKWNRKGQNELEITSTVVDSYKYFQMGAGEPEGGRTETWKVSGETFGPVQRLLTRGKDNFEPATQFRSVAEVMRFWAHFVQKQ